MTFARKQNQDRTPSAAGYRLPTLKAFTLVELIISIAIFAIFMSMAIAAYLQLSVALKRENIDRKLYSEIESVITDIQRQAKFYDIDYGEYGGTVQWPETRLALISHDGLSRIEYGRTANAELGILKQDCTPQPLGRSCLDAPGFNSPALSPLTSNELRVSDLAFYIHPNDPKQVDDPASPIIYQPRVTIIIRGEIDNPYRRDPRPFTIQTSISMRHYQ